MTVCNYEEAIGFVPQRTPEERDQRRKDTVDFIALKLIATGQPVPLSLKASDPLGIERILTTHFQRLISESKTIWLGISKGCSRQRN
jgi:hypothetical protein